MKTRGGALYYLLAALINDRLALCIFAVVLTALAIVAYGVSVEVELIDVILFLCLATAVVETIRYVRPKK